MCIKKIPIFDLQIVGKCLFVYLEAFIYLEAFFVNINYIVITKTVRVYFIRFRLLKLNCYFSYQIFLML